jgi:sigma-B regulation protein RsbU (phosphoserine phosphatase)
MRPTPAAASEVMMVSIRNSVTLKIGLLVLGSSCLVLALVMYRSYVNSRELIREEAEKGARYLTASLADQLEQEFLLAGKAAEDLATFLEVGGWDEKTLEKRLRLLVMRNKPVFGSTVAFLPYQFKRGVKLYAPYYCKSKSGIRFEQLGAGSYDYLKKDWFRIPVEEGRPVWSKPYVDRGGGGIAMTTYSHPLFRKNAEGTETVLKAVVTADLSLKRLNDRVNAMRLYDTGFCFVVSDKGTVVTARRAEFVMKSSIFDVVRKFDPERGLSLARAMITEESGFYDVGSAFTGEDSFCAFARIRPPGWTLGAVLPKKELFAKVESLHKKTMLVAVAGILLLAVAAVLVARSISRPLRRMSEEALKVADGDLDIDLSDIRSSDEVGRLARSFTRMTEGLKDRDRIKDTFGRYLTQEVVKRLLESEDGLKLGGEIRDISLMMSDLRGFTALTATMRPDQVITFLNRYLGKMVEIILDHHGIIDEIIGDGILAFFGAPEDRENHPELAVACAIKMQNAMEEVNEMNDADGLPHLEMGVAVNTGEVVVGNIGSEKRAKYGAVGSHVNLTGRIESFTVGGQVLISESTYDRLREKLEIRNTLEVEMKGVPGKAALYDVGGIKGDHGASLAERHESLVRLEREIELHVFGMDEKILKTTGMKAVVTHASMSSAKMVFERAVARWENLRMVPEEDDPETSDRVIYGKAISVEERGEGVEANVRFTSVSAEARKMLAAIVG